ncbi:MAG: hypothetical protein U0Z53_30490 [Blastocatellia bacterium]
MKTLKPLLLITACSLLACSQPPAEKPALPVTSQAPMKTGLTLASYDLNGKSPQEIARFVFASHNCSDCHTLEKGKFGYTERGAKLRGESGGCVMTLTAMQQIAAVPAAQRNEKQQAIAARFKENGCVFCHEEKNGRLGTTEIGSRLAAMHLSCTGLEKQLTQ